MKLLLLFCKLYEIKLISMITEQIATQVVTQAAGDIIKKEFASLPNRQQQYIANVALLSLAIVVLVVTVNNLAELQNG